ncbi:RraA family protein [Wukongibacter sp. M2B1]|uniref:RraA family protein n=1 Tax=Wukongibacter sp. M2B1 TaxID=3088895 RepID=UPI003D790881
MCEIDREIIDRYRKLDTGIISDVMGRKRVMRSSIKCHYQNSVKVVGQAFTVDSMVGCNIMSHYALTKIKKGQILVIDAKGFEDVSVWGGIQTYYAKKIGIEAVVIDGSVRDIKEIRELLFPIFYKNVTPAGPHKGWRDKMNVSISVGGVSVNPYDLIIGDDDGVVVVPFDNIKEVLHQAEKKKELEEEWINRIDKGLNIVEAINLTETIKYLGISEGD